MINLNITEISQGWNLKNLSCDPPRIIIKLYYNSSGGSSEPIVKAALKSTSSSSTSSGNYEELDLSKLCSYPELHTDDETYNYLGYRFKNPSEYGFTSCSIQLDKTTDAPIAVGLEEYQSYVGPIVS